MFVETKSFLVPFTLVLIIVTIIANAEPVPEPMAVITKKDAMDFFKRQIKKNIYQPAKAQVMPIIKAVTNSFAEGLKNATSNAIIKGRDAFVNMKKVNEKKNERNNEMKTDYNNDISFDDSYD